MSAIKQKGEPGADTLVSCFDYEEMNMSLINATAPLLADTHSCDTMHSDTAPATEGVLPYDPNRLLDTVAQRLGISGDRMLSRMLQLSLQIIRGMRAGQLPVRASILLSIAESVGTSIDDLRQILGDRRSKARMSFTLLAT
jgi:hypothetical protein